MEYLAPTAEIVLLQSETFICESPIPGGNEGVGFENWN